MPNLTAFATTLQVQLLLLALVALGLVAVIVLAARRVLGRSRLAPRIRHSIMLVVVGPVSAGIIGLALIEMIRLSAAQLPPPLSAEELTLIIELAVLAIAIRTAGAVAKHIMAHVTGTEGLERVLVYGIYALGLLAVAYALLNSPGSPRVVGGVWQTVGFFAGLTITYLVVYVVSAVTKRYGEALYEREPQLRTTITFVRRLIIGLVALVGVAATTFTIFPAAGTAVASIFVAAGFASIVVGLAAQSSLANIFAGMIVSTAQPFRIGDALLFKNEWAWVEDIRLTFTVLKTWDNRRLVVPNQLFLTEAMVNYDLNDSSKLVVVFVQVPYETDLDRAIELMKAAVRGHPDFLPAGNLPVVHVMEYNESGISLRLLGNAKDQPTAFQMSKDLLYTIRKDFLAAGIQISYPRREVVFKEGRGDGGQAPGTGRDGH
jgi:small-conductance mechanosensitive channel